MVATSTCQTLNVRNDELYPLFILSMLFLISVHLLTLLPLPRNTAFSFSSLANFSTLKFHPSVLDRSSSNTCANFYNFNLICYNIIMFMGWYLPLHCKLFEGKFYILVNFGNPVTDIYLAHNRYLINP